MEKENFPSGLESLFFCFLQVAICLDNDLASHLLEINAFIPQFILHCCLLHNTFAKWAVVINVTFQT